MPWGASTPLISPTTLLVAGSMMWMLSPAEFVCRIRSFEPCAESDEKEAAPKRMPMRAASPAKVCLFIIFAIRCFARRPIAPAPVPRLSNRRLLHGLADNECFQRQPVGVFLRAELLGAAVVSIATSVFGKGMFEQRALDVSGRSHALD